MEGFEIRENRRTADCILTGYYCAYYTNGGKKAKSPKELISSLHRKRQSRDEGFRDIERIKQLERRRNGAKEEESNGERS